MKLGYGAYLKFDEHNNMHRMIYTTDGEKIVEDRTLDQEVLFYANFKLNKYDDILKRINEITNEVTDVDDNFEFRRPNDLAKLETVIGEFISKLKSDNLLLGTLVELTFKDAYTPDNGGLFYLAEVKALTLELVRETINFMNFFRHYILSLFNNTTDELKLSVAVPICNMAMTYEDGFQEIYHFRSIKSYFSFILIEWLKTKPNIAQCEWCSEFFSPKTRKKTKYCEDCRKVASKSRYKINVENDHVLETYNKTYQKMYRRMQRTFDSLSKTPKSLTLDEFYVWFDAASEARKKYLQGEITAEEALKIIVVE